MCFVGIYICMLLCFTAADADIVMMHHSKGSECNVPYHSDNSNCTVIKHDNNGDGGMTGLTRPRIPIGPSGTSPGNRQPTSLQ